MSLFQKKINGASCPVARARGAPLARFAPLVPFLVKLVTTTTPVVCILLHSRTISYSDPQNVLGWVTHMKSGRPDEQSSWAHFRKFCHWIKFDQAHFLQKFHSTLQWVQEKALHHKNQEIIQAQLMFLRDLL